MVVNGIKRKMIPSGYLAFQEQNSEKHCSVNGMRDTNPAHIVEEVEGPNTGETW